MSDKSLIELFVDVINGKEYGASEIINSCLAIIEKIHVDVGCPEEDVNELLKKAVIELNSMVPSKDA